LLGSNRALLLTDGRYSEQATAEAAGVGIRIGRRGLAALLGESVAECVDSLNGTVVGFESEHLTVSLEHRLAETTPVHWKATRGVVEGVRCSKDDDEIDLIRSALRLAESVLVEVIAGLEPGVREREVAAQIEYACRRAGAEGMAFETIVASGSRTALPHAGAGERRLRGGEPLMIDMGCRVNGYCSDITRMVWLGAEVGEEVLDLHRVIAAAQESAISEARAGIPAAEVDRAARQVISDSGFGEAFVHGTGHGVGLEIHEAPAVSERSEERLVAGSVITIEPAVYLPGSVGVRLEDMICVREDGCDRLTTLGTEPMLA
jgi:Xaa-Pro aminopeptidase